MQTQVNEKILTHGRNTITNNRQHSAAHINADLRKAQSDFARVRAY